MGSQAKKAGDITNYIVPTERCGDLHVHVQGEVSQQEKRAVFLTVHDLGTNHQSFTEFVNHPCMQEIRDRSIFVHVDIPGHHDNAESLPESFEFPSLQTIGEDLVTVLDFLHIKYVVCLGEGAGANVLARFGLKYPSRCLGLILINCTGSAASVMDSLKNKAVNWKSDDKLSQSAEHYLVFHKFGHLMSSEHLNDQNQDKEKVMQEYLDRLQNSTLNPKNVKAYVQAFMTRKDLILKDCKVDIILIMGILGSYASAVDKLHKDLDKNKSTLLKIERAGDVMTEAPAKVAHSILLFCKGQGLLTSVAMPGIDRQRTFSGSSGEGESQPGRRRLSRGMSMEEYDKPNIRRLSLSMPDPLPPPAPATRAN